MTKTTPKRNRAQTVAVIRDHMRSPRWKVFERGQFYTVEPQFVLAAGVGPMPIEPERFYRFDRRANSALEQARECCADLRANALADALSELGK